MTNVAHSLQDVHIPDAMNTLRIALRFLIRCGIPLFWLSIATAGYGNTSSHQSLHDVYLANTEHELHIYRIYGKEPGKTIMLIGGIQGDEPGGYLTADLYADISLKRGNLIVVPRANFYSILLNQRNGMTGDMNRKFAEKDDAARSMEQEIVAILKRLIGEADCLLNLHEGSGFFNPEWKNDQENPDRFGQSIIYDAKSYYAEKKRRTIELESLATRITEKVNRQVTNRRYRFRPNNHNSVADDTRHFEQRKSATYYALTQEGIPAFGIETSKAISSNSEKVAFQKMVVNAFMEEFDIIPETPGLHIENTKIDYILVKINGGLPYAVPSGTGLQIESGDEVVVTDIIANYDRGLAADFVGMGSRNDTNLPFRIAQPTKVLIRKDAETCGWVDIGIGTGAAANISVRTGEQPSPSSPAATETSTVTKPLPLSELKAEQLVVDVNGELLFVAEGEEIGVAGNMMLIIKGVRSNISRLDHDIAVNLKGFAPPKAKNNGNDINYPIYPIQDLWVRYSEKREGIRYPISTTYNDREIGKFWIRIN